MTADTDSAPPETAFSVTIGPIEGDDIPEPAAQPQQPPCGSDKPFTTPSKIAWRDRLAQAQRLNSPQLVQQAKRNIHGLTPRRFR